MNNREAMKPIVAEIIRAVDIQRAILPGCILPVYDNARRNPAGGLCMHVLVMLAIVDPLIHLLKLHDDDVKRAGFELLKKLLREWKAFQDVLTERLQADAFELGRLMPAVLDEAESLAPELARYVPQRDAMLENRSDFKPSPGEYAPGGSAFCLPAWQRGRAEALAILEFQTRSPFNAWAAIGTAAEAVGLPRPKWAPMAESLVEPQPAAEAAAVEPVKQVVPPGLTADAATKLLDIATVAARLGKGETTIRNWCRASKRPCHKAFEHAGRWWIPEADVPL